MDFRDLGRAIEDSVDSDGLRDGYVASGPDENGHIEVVTPGFSDSLRHGPCVVMPRGSDMPKRGDKCLVAFSDNQQPWVIAWDPA